MSLTLGVDGLPGLGPQRTVGTEWQSIQSKTYTSRRPRKLLSFWGQTWSDRLGGLRAHPLCCVDLGLINLRGGILGSKSVRVCPTLTRVNPKQGAVYILDLKGQVEILGICLKEKIGIFIWTLKPSYMDSSLTLSEEALKALRELSNNLGLDSVSRNGSTSSTGDGLYYLFSLRK